MRSFIITLFLALIFLLLTGNVKALTPDLDGDQDTDFLDFVRLITAFNTNNSLLDFNLNGKVDLFDFSHLISRIGLPAPSPTLLPTPSPTITPATKAFPGAAGFGSGATGGRGGRVIYVKNLNDSGPDSLRAALEASGKRIVVFKTGGLIQLSTPIDITDPDITVAGQTAPPNSGGIVLSRAGITIAAPNVIVRGMRFRIGDEPEGPEYRIRDGIGVSTTRATGDIYDVIVDHNSIAWAVDENTAVWESPDYARRVYNVTYSWNIISEALHDSFHIDEGRTTPAPHSKGLLMGDNLRNVSAHHNLFAHNDDRHPLIKGVVEAEVINNLIYNWGSSSTNINSFKSIGHIIGNYYKSTVDSRGSELQFGSSTSYVDGTNIHPETRMYIANNYANDADVTGNNFRMDYARSWALANDWLFTGSGIPTTDAPTAYTQVLASAGASAPAYDPIDVRIKSQVQNRTGQIIDSQNQVGGWPAYPTGTPLPDSDADGMPNSWEIGHGLNPNSGSDANLLAPSGYTWIEEYINSLIP